MSNPTRVPTSHGHTGDTAAPAVPEHKSYGGRDEVGGGPAGRGNDGAVTTDTGRDWSAGDNEGRKDAEAAPVTRTGDKPKNLFSR